MDGPGRPEQPPAGSQVQQTADPDKQTRRSEVSKRKAFNRSVVKLKDTPPLLKKWDNRESGRPEQPRLVIAEQYQLPVDWRIIHD